jgi:hypothetical protein
MKSATKRLAVSLGVVGTVGAVLGAVLVGRGDSGAIAPAASGPSGSRPVDTAHATHSRSDRPVRNDTVGAASPHARLGWASASTIPAGKLQFCVQGDYWASFHIEPVPIPGTAGTTFGSRALAMPPGGCELMEFPTHGQWVPVEMMGFDPATNRPFWVGRAFYNSTYGLGLGTEGTASSPFWWQW